MTLIPLVLHRNVTISSGIYRGISNVVSPRLHDELDNFLNRPNLALTYPTTSDNVYSEIGIGVLTKALSGAATSTNQHVATDRSRPHRMSGTSPPPNTPQEGGSPAGSPRGPKN